MNPIQKNYDVVIVGGSIAGCTAAILLGRQGLRVAVIERQADINAFKKLCTHYIQPSATPTIQRLGLDKGIEAAGGVRNAIDIWTKYGWIKAVEDKRFPTYGYSIRREKLDPMLRKLAQQTQGVDLYLGHVAKELQWENGRISGIIATHERQNLVFNAQLVVAADGHYSKLAKLAEVAEQVRENMRFGYMAFYRNMSLTSGTRAQIWLMNPDAAYLFPNDDGLTLVTCMPHKDKLPLFRDDLEKAFVNYVRTLPDGPNWEEAERVSDIFGVVKYDLISRKPTASGMALIGDAALSSDPLWGIGCGWAFESAEWLAEAVGETLPCKGDLNLALQKYHKRHQRHLIGHHRYISSLANGRSFWPPERLAFAAAARDAEIAKHIHAYAGRHIGVSQLFSPIAFAKITWSYIRTKAFES